MALTPKQSRFVDEYLIDLNATQAAIRAGYSAKNAESIGYQQLQKTPVQQAIQEAQKKLIERTRITQERVLQEYAKIAFFDPRRMFNDDGTLKQISQLDDDVAAVIGGIDVSEIKYGDEVEGDLKKIKLIDKKGALDSLARHLGMFVDRHEINSTIKIDQSPMTTLFDDE